MPLLFILFLTFLDFLKEHRCGDRYCDELDPITSHNKEVTTLFITGGYVLKLMNLSAMGSTLYYLLKLSFII